VAEGNGRWQFGFWIMTVLFLGWCGALTGNLVANDRIRASEDMTVRSYVDLRADRNAATISALMKENAEAHQEIKITLARISERLGINEMHKEVSSSRS
jgi:hypothetical protein